MFERTLKDLANRHFEVMWRYENMTNSIIVRLKKTVRSSMVQA